MQNRPREQDSDAWQTSAEVKAGSARLVLSGELLPERKRSSLHSAYQGFDKKMHLTYNHHVDIDFNPRVFKGRAERSWAGDGVPKEVV